MNIQNLNTYQQTSQMSYKGGASYINKVNPASHYFDKFFNKSAIETLTKFDDILPALEGKIKTINIKNISAWDINPEKSENYVFFLHGMSQNVSNYQKMYEELLLKNQGVFAVEYRGYGTNKENKVSESKLRKDVELAYNYLTETKGIKPQNITVIGHSLGGALATNFASKHPEIKSLILLCPIVKPSFIGEKFKTNKNLGIGMPNCIKNITDKLKPLKWLLDFRFNSLSKMKNNTIPTYIIQSRNDCVTTIGGARKLAKAARRQNILKDFISLPLGGHKVDSVKIEAISKIFDNMDNFQV